ncbi:MAG: hypothetical protein FJW23_00285 [Acidimicrobiia bacterium]|nr:hypothetical protein [Acidimicrobiia bacterium]
MTNRHVRWILLGALLLVSGRPGAAVAQKICLVLTVPQEAPASTTPPAGPASALADVVPVVPGLE